VYSSFDVHSFSSLDWLSRAHPFSFNISDSHEVVLTSGDLLFYESSKLFHGRPKKFIGTWYTSVFVHYYPKYGWMDEDIDRRQEKVFAIPPHWDQAPTTHNEIPLQMVGTSMKEPACPHQWCSTQTAIPWNYGPGKEGFWIAPTGEKFPLVESLACVDNDPQCDTWISLDSNVCEEDALFMMGQCRMSCAACGEAEEYDENQGDNADEHEEDYGEEDYVEEEHGEEEHSEEEHGEEEHGDEEDGEEHNDGYDDEHDEEYEEGLEDESEEEL
jgi:hypothetical protein